MRNVRVAEKWAAARAAAAWGARPYRVAGWTREAINRARVTEVPDLERVVVAAVPGIPGHTTGIVAAGRSAYGDGHFYLLGDHSTAGAPAEIAERAVAAYRDRGADVIAGEVNEVGDYLGKLLRLADDGVQYKALHASRDIATRAKFAGVLYEQGRVHHAEVFPELEDRMVTWDGIHSRARIGALVCAITELESR